MREIQSKALIPFWNGELTVGGKERSAKGHFRHAGLSIEEL